MEAILLIKLFLISFLETTSTEQWRWNWFKIVIIICYMKHGFSGNIAVYGLGSPSKNGLWSKAKQTGYCPKRHVLFVILYWIYGLITSYCLTTSTNYFINQTNVKYHSFEVKTIKKLFLRPIIVLANQKAVTFVVWCMLYQSTYVHTTLNLYWPVYKNSRYRVVCPWSINSLLRAFIVI